MFESANSLTESRDTTASHSLNQPPLLLFFQHTNIIRNDLASTFHLLLKIFGYFSRSFSVCPLPNGRTVPNAAHFCRNVTSVVA